MTKNLARIGRPSTLMVLWSLNAGCAADHLDSELLHVRRRIRFVVDLSLHRFEAAAPRSEKKTTA
jgi:hypothetical protein